MIGEATHRALGHLFRVDGDRAGLALVARALACMELASAALTPPSCVYSLRRLGSVWEARQGDAVVFTGPADHALSRLVTAINVAAIASAAPTPVVHAAVVTVNGGAIVVPGPSGSGKSTLAATLAMSGFAYLSDEAAPLRDDGQVEPYHKPIILGRDAMAALPGLRDVGDEGGDLCIVDPRQLASGLGGPAPLRLVVVAEFQRGTTVELVPISRAVAVAALLANLFNLRELGAQCLPRVEAVTRRARAVRLRHGGGLAAIAAISRLVDW